MSRPIIDPAMGLKLVAARTLETKSSSVTVLIPAHNEESTIAEVVYEARHGLDLLGVAGEVIVSASACTDHTALLAADAGASVIEAPIGKGSAILYGLKAAQGDIICLIDGDLKYFGNTPLSALLVEPILRGLADACISDLYWRPLYPQLWLYGFFAPIAGMLYPDMLPKVGSTPWSGQRAAIRELWPAELPDDFTVDLTLLLHWNQYASKMHPVLADDWMNPQRPKPNLMAQELNVLVNHALTEARINEHEASAIRAWYEDAHRLMAEYQPERDESQQFERQVFSSSRAALLKRFRNVERVTDV